MRLSLATNATFHPRRPSRRIAQTAASVLEGGIAQGANHRLPRPGSAPARCNTTVAHWTVACGEVGTTCRCRDTIAIGGRLRNRPFADVHRRDGCTERRRWTPCQFSTVAS